MSVHERSIDVQGTAITSGCIGCCSIVATWVLVLSSVAGAIFVHMVGNPLDYMSGVIAGLVFMVTGLIATSIAGLSVAISGGVLTYVVLAIVLSVAKASSTSHTSVRLTASFIAAIICLAAGAILSPITLSIVAGEFNPNFSASVGSVPPIICTVLCATVAGMCVWTASKPTSPSSEN